MFRVWITKQSGERVSTGPLYITKRRAQNEAARWQRLNFVAAVEVEEVA
jgi:hypothetical protein